MQSLLAALLLVLDAMSAYEALGTQAPAARRAAVAELIVQHAHAVHVDPVLVAAIVSMENPRLAPTARNRANVGIMQVHTSWLRRADWRRACGSDLADTGTNICFGVRVLAAHLAERRSLADGLLAYNGCKSARCRGYATKVLARRDAARWLRPD